MQPTIPIDAENGGDWIKAGSWDLPTDPEEFMDFVMPFCGSLEKFLSLPVARAMPKELREALGLEQPFLEMVEE